MHQNTDKYCINEQYFAFPSKSTSLADNVPMKPFTVTLCAYEIKFFLVACVYLFI